MHSHTAPNVFVVDGICDLDLRKKVSKRRGLFFGFPVPVCVIELRTFLFDMMVDVREPPQSLLFGRP